MLGATAGTLYAFTMPPLQVADERTHLVRAFDVTRGSCIAAERTPVPRSVMLFGEAFPPVLEKRRLITQQGVWRWAAVPLRSEQTREARATAAKVYSCVPYLAAAAGIRVATALDASPLWVLYASRLANLLAYLCLVALALAILPDFHAVLLALALMPMTLHQAASPSADAMTIATAFLVTALAVRGAVGRDRDASPVKRAWALSGALTVAALCKTNVALVPLAALVPRRSSRGGAARVLLVAVPAVCAALLFAWANGSNIELFRRAQTARHGGQVEVSFLNALVQPVSFLASVARTLAHQATAYVEQFIGVLGWATVRRPAWTTWLYGALLLAAPLLGARYLRLTVAHRAALAGAAALGFLSAMASLYAISGSAVRGTFGAPFGGVAGRYFIPFALPALLAVSTVRWRRAEAAYGVAVVAVAALVNAVTLGTIRGHYYLAEPLVVDTSVFDLAPSRVVPMNAGTRVEQTFAPRFNGLARIDLDVSTYGRRIPSGALRASVLASDGRALVEQRLPLDSLKDGSRVSVQFAPLVQSRGRKLRLELSLDGVAPGYLLGLYATGAGRDVYPAGELSVDGVATGGDLHFRAYVPGKRRHA